MTDFEDCQASLIGFDCGFESHGSLAVEFPFDDADGGAGCNQFSLDVVAAAAADCARGIQLSVLAAANEANGCLDIAPVLGPPACHGSLAGDERAHGSEIY